MQTPTRMTRLLPLLLLGYFFSCEKPTEPKMDTEPDTTSHNILWRVDTLGTYLSTVRDVAIVNENDIWAVGEFYKKHSTFDSTAADIYNAAHWNGIKWEFVKVPIEINYGIGQGGIVSVVTHTLYSVFVIEEKVIFSYAGVTVLENAQFKMVRTPNFSEPGSNKFSAHHIWAKDQSNIWFVGNLGTIIYYNGSTFTRIPYDETVDFIDIWGDESGTVRAVGRTRGTFATEIIILKNNQIGTINRGQGQPIDNNSPDIFLSVWWKDSNTKLLWLVADNGVYTSSDNNHLIKIINSYTFQPWIGTLSVRGANDNDMLLAGINGQLIHYNGKTIRHYMDAYNQRIKYTSADVKSDVYCAGGFFYDNATDNFSGIIAIGLKK